MHHPSRRSRSRLLLPAFLCLFAGRAFAVPTAALTASPNPVNESANFSLTGTGTATEVGETVTNYRYEEISPVAAVLYDGVPKATVGPIKAPVVGPSGAVLQYRLTVTTLNNLGQTRTATADRAVVVNNVLSAPVANAGANFSVRVLKTGQLNGSGTDVNGTIVSYAWTQTAGTVVALSNPALPNPTFTAPATAQTLTFRLIVKDDDGQSSAADSVSVTVQANSPPVVNAGPVSTTVNEGTLVTLDGTVTDANNDPLTYQWTQLTGPRTLSINNATNVDASFTAPLVTSTETYSFRLSASDGLAVVSDTITVNVVSVNHAPTASAGASQGVVEGAAVTLSGAGSSDPDGDTLTYAWVQSATPAGQPAVVLTGAGTATPSFTAPQISTPTVTLRFRLTVTDGHGGSSSATTDVVVQDSSSANRAPTANAGPDQSVEGGASVTLAGAGSDPDNNVISYKWTQVAGPRPVTLVNAGQATARFTAPSPESEETYVFQLTVSDGVLTGADTATVVVKGAVPAATSSGIPLIANPKVFPSPFSPARGGATIRYTLRSASDVTILISDIFGRQVREFRQAAGGQGGVAGDNDLAWDGRNGDGESLGNGAYIVQITARDGNGAQGKVSDRVGVRH